MRKILSSLLFLPFLAFTSLSSEETVQLESNHFSVTEDAVIPFLSQETLNEIDQDIDTFLTNFHLTLDEKFSVQIYLEKSIAMEKIFVSEQFGPLSRYLKTRWIDIDKPLDPESFLPDAEKAKWITLQSGFEFLFDGKIGDKGHNGNFLEFAYLRHYFLSYSAYEGLAERIRQRLAILVLDKTNFSLALFAKIPDPEHIPTPEEREEMDRYFNDVLFPLSMSFVDFVITDYGYDTMLQMLTNDDIYSILGITQEEFDNLWYVYAQSKIPPT